MQTILSISVMDREFTLLITQKQKFNPVQKQNMNKTVIIILFIFCISYYSVYAQLRQGIITSADGTPIAGATILIEKQSINRATNSNGVYTVYLAEGEHQIIILAEGYKPLTKMIQCTSYYCLLDFFMEKDLQELETVTIQGNRHEKNILNTTASISEISSKSIKETQTELLKDLNSLIPNYIYSDLGVNYQQQITLRGVSAFSEVPSVATYIDGINTFNISANNLLLNDVEKIEVFRGPQGAVFGQDALGGIINIVTKKPSSNNKSAFIETSIGNQGFYSYAAGFKTPVIKNILFIGVDGKLNSQHGFYRNNLTGTFSFDGKPLEKSSENGVRIGDQQAYYGNIDINLRPDEKLDLLFNIKKQIDQSIGASSFYQAALTPQKALDNPYEFSVNSIGSDHRDVLNLSLRIKYEGSNYVIQSSSYYSKVKTGYNKIDGDLTPFDFYSASSSYKGILGNPFPLEVIGQEIKIESDKEKRLSWLVGGSVFFQNYQKQYSYVGKSTVQEYKDFQENTGVSSFGRISYQVSEKFDITLHGRYDTETKNIKASVSDTNTKNKIDIIESINRKKNFYALSPKLVFSYAPSLNHKLYLSYARGFKPGGINNRVVNENDFSSYDSEYSNIIESGYKWLSNDNKYLISATGYTMYWQDMQLYYFSQQADRPDIRGIWIIDNIGNVKSYGLETEVTAKPFSGFQIDYSLGINHGRYSGFEFLGTNIKDNTTILSPEFTSFLGAQQLFSLLKKKNITGIIRGEWRVVGDQYFDLANTIKQSAYQIFNTRLSIANNNVSLAFGIKNIFNERYISFSMPGQFKASILNRPRTFTISLIYRL